MSTRLTRSQAKANLEQQNCSSCTRVETSEPISECTRCKKWLHHSCAGVGENVLQEIDFVCIPCAQRDLAKSMSSKSVRSSTSSVRQARLQLELKKLEEQKAIQQQYLDKKYEILQASLDAESDIVSSQSRRSVRSEELSRVETWVQEQSVVEARALSKVTVLDTNKDSSAKTNATIAAQVAATNLPVQEAAQNRQQVQVGLPGANECDPAFRKPNYVELSEISPVAGRSFGLVTDTVISPAGATMNTQTAVKTMCSVTEGASNYEATPIQLMGIGEQQLMTSADDRQLQMLPNVPTGSETTPFVSQSSAPVSSNQITTRPQPILYHPLNITHYRINKILPPTLKRPTNQSHYSAWSEFSPIVSNVSQNQNDRNEYEFGNSVVNEILDPRSIVRRHHPGNVSSRVIPATDHQHIPQTSTQMPFDNGMEGSFRNAVACGVSADQLAARHVVPKDLPFFSGDPADWPLFISNYTNSTVMCGYSNAENLMRLQRCLKGSAKDAVCCFLLHPSSVQRIISTLETLYGRPEQIVNALLQKIRATPSPKADKLETLVHFGLAVQNFCEYLRAVDLQSHLTNPTLMQELVDKLPSNIKLDWALYLRQCSSADLGNFSDYMSTLVSAASRVTLSASYEKGPSGREEKSKPKEKAYVNTHVPNQHNEGRRNEKANEPKKGELKQCVVCHKSGHKVRDCFTFKNLTVPERWKAVQQHNICRRCLGFHGRWPCKASLCGENECRESHNRLLHPKETVGASTNMSSTVAMHRFTDSNTLFRIVPVVVYGKNRSIETYAILDDASSITMMEEELATQLGAAGQSENLCLQWTGGVTKTIPASQVLEVQISGCRMEKQYNMKVHTVDNLELPQQNMDYKKLSKEFPYLRGLPVCELKNAVPRVLIGQDNTYLMTSLKVREGQPGEPVATKTRIGWSVHGVVKNNRQMQFLHRTFHTSVRSEDEDLHDLVKQYFSIDSIGIIAAPHIEGEDDHRAKNSLQQTTVRLPSGHFQTSLLWKHDYIEFPDSRFAAEKRLVCLERKLERDADLYEKVRLHIREYERKGYAHKVDSVEFAELDPRRIWFLPINVVLNPRKPTKIRVVWDAAAKVAGVSLNSKLLKGPDLLNSMTSVLFQYRQRQFVINGDIKEMFHQVYIRPEDRQSQLFLWRDDKSKPAEIFMMDVMIFGSACSPCAAHYVKNLNAKEHQNTHPKAAAAILNNHYVDDFLDSVDSEDEAVQLALQVKEVHSKAGFEIRNWLSNSNEVLRRLGESSSGSVKNFTVIEKDGAERILGMVWIPSEDVFCFPMEFRPEVQPLLTSCTALTKRQMLKVLMSIFDPLGLIAAITIHGKILLQDVWRSRVGWDDVIPQDIFSRWLRWMEIIQELRVVKIPRCYFPGYHPASFDSLELHVFVDASELAYAAVAYFRIMDRGEIRCSLIAAKTKVAPLQALSIPRLELQAAVIGVRLAKSIVEQHGIPVSRRYFWSDSSTVISWLNSDQRRYRQYVAYRINEILSDSEAKEWRWISTRLNIADVATKWQKKSNLVDDSRWFQGPTFLYSSNDNWPQHSELVETAEELRSVYLHYHKVTSDLIDIQRFSKWERLLRSLAYVYHLVRRFNNLSQENCGSGLTRQALQRAEQTLWKLAQNDAYQDELCVLKQNQERLDRRTVQLEKSSSIYKLSPFLDLNGVLRMETRLVSDIVAYDTKYPVILPREHRITHLILDSYHRKYGHENGEIIVNEVRQKFYISRLRTEIRRVARHCQWCRIYKTVPVAPRMAALPVERLTPNIRPFTYTGIDFFGPYLIKVGRKAVKRWVALFTCLTIRAIHLESVASLSTDSCKKAIRRFVARRGSPQEIFSDQGTNFVGASRELQREIKCINQDLASTFTDGNTQWHFNPPSAPHMGGCWERMVRAVKKAMECLSTCKNLDEESFCTLLGEAEAMVNSRPLTYIPLETAEQESLTPNHFLIMHSSGVTQPVKESVDNGQALRNCWNRLQHLLGLFWTRWVKSYLPTIARRTKWFSDTRPIAVGDLVVVVDENIRNRWVRGRVVKVFPGRDGRIRRAEVQTANRVLQRPVIKLALLDVDGKGITEVQPPVIRSGECSHSDCEPQNRVITVRTSL